MKDGLNELAAREEELVGLYMDLTGTAESVARAVFMHVCCRADEDSTIVEADCGVDAPQVRAERKSELRRAGTSPSWAGSVVPAPARA
jgi:hypothetical protein